MTLCLARQYNKACRFTRIPWSPYWHVNLHCCRLYGTTSSAKNLTVHHRFQLTLLIYKTPPQNENNAQPREDGDARPLPHGISVGCRHMVLLPATSKLEVTARQLRKVANRTHTHTRTQSHTCTRIYKRTRARVSKHWHVSAENVARKLGSCAPCSIGGAGVWFNLRVFQRIHDTTRMKS